MLNKISTVLVIVFMLVHGWPTSGTAKQLLKDIRFEAVSPDEEQVVFQLSSPDMPTFFTMKGENPRAVFDFKETEAARGIRNTIIPDDSTIRAKPHVSLAIFNN